MAERFTWYGTMPPHGNPNDHRRPEVTIYVRHELKENKWKANVHFHSEEGASQPPSILRIGEELGDFYPTMNDLYYALIDYFGYTPTNL